MKTTDWVRERRREIEEGRELTASGPNTHLLSFRISDEAWQELARLSALLKMRRAVVMRTIFNQGVAEALEALEADLSDAPQSP